MRGSISIFRDYKRGALALLGLSAAVLCGAAIAHPVDRPERAEQDWVALPQVTPKAEVIPAVEIDDSMIEVASTAALGRTLELAEYGLKSIRRGSARVPRFFVENLPDDFDKRMVVDKRKRMFIRTVLPLILKANEEVMAERRRLVSIEEQLSSGHDVHPTDLFWLEELAEKYRVAPNDFATLLRRVDAVSPTVALAQSIEESGWGRSRFARLGNALFGQRVWSEGGGFVPEERAEGETFEVRAFDSLLDSVRGYVLNLNRHHTYADYRHVRAQMRANATELDGVRLTETLVNYSERRLGYVEAIRKLIASNRLEQFENARLATEPVAVDDTQVASR